MSREIMACPDQETLLRFVDNETEPGERDRLQRHIGECADCRAAIGEFKEIDGQLRASAPSLDRLADRAGCFDGMALARYRSGSLKDSEREQLEAHLADCAACVERVAELDARMSEPLLKTPESLLQAALDLEEKKGGGFWAALHRWFGAAGVGRLSFAGAGACAVILLAVFLAQRDFQPGDPPGKTPGGLIEPRGGQGPKAQDVVVQTKLALSDRLIAVLAAEDKAKTGAALRAMIETEAPQIPLAAINAIEIDSNLSAAIRAKRELPDRVAVILDNKGTLWIHADR